MAAVQVHFIYTGGGRDVIPLDATHVTIHDSITVIPSKLFREHPNIVELICHEGVERIEDQAFYRCPRLRRVIIPGVKALWEYCFSDCDALIFVECPKLETIGEGAFLCCKSLISINLQLVKVVREFAFAESALSNAEFGSNLESMEYGYGTFSECHALERITLPLKYGLVQNDYTFTACSKLTRVICIERAVLHKTIDALFMDNWRDDMNVEVDSINQSLPHAYAGSMYDGGVLNHGEKAHVIQEWIERVLRKVARYKTQHRRILEEATSTLQLVLPRDIVLNYIVSFLELPPHTFDGEDDDSDESQYSSEDSDSDSSYGEME